MADTWVADNGQFHRVSRLWVAEGGQFHEVTTMWAADNGQFRDSGAGDKPQLLSFYVQKAVTGYYEASATWNVRAASFDAAGNGDKIWFTWESASGKRGSSDPQLATSGTAVLPLGSPNTWWKVHLWLKYKGTTSLLGTVDVQTSALPAPPNVSVAQTTEWFWVNHVLTWSTVPYATGYSVHYYVNGSNQVQVASVPAAGGAVQSFSLNRLAQNKPFSYYVRALLNDGTTTWESQPSALLGQTIALYAPGVYEVSAVQKRTLIMGDKKRPRQWRPASNDQIFCGHGGATNDEGTQVGFIFYWEDNNTNPFQTIRDQMNRGAKVTRLQIRLNRSAVGNNKPIRPIARTHVYKQWPGDGNLNGNMHDNWERVAQSVNINERVWIDLDPGKAELLTRDTGNGIALGSTANKLEDYMAYWKDDTGKLRFTLE